MDLFEEALQHWEEALTFRSRQGDEDAICTSVKTGAGDAIAEQSMEVNHIEHVFLWHQSLFLSCCGQIELLLKEAPT